MTSNSKTFPFTHNGANYVIHFAYESNVVRIQALTSDHQPCGFEYTVSLPQKYYVEGLLESNVVKSLIVEAHRDVAEGRWSNDLAMLESSIMPKYVNHSDDWNSHSGSFEHRDFFDRPISEGRYKEFLERVNYHGFPFEGYGINVRQDDDEGKVWVYLHSRSCD